MGIYNSINEAFERKYGLKDVKNTKNTKKLNEAKDLPNIKGTIANVLNKNMDKIAKINNVAEMKKAIIDILDNSEIKDTQAVKSLKVKFNNAKSVSGLLSMIGTYITGMRVDNGKKNEDMSKVGNKKLRKSTKTGLKAGNVKGKKLKESLNESFKDAIKNWLKDDKASSIVYNWYDTEGAFDDFEDEDEFISYAKHDIKDMIDAATDPQEIEIVKRALNIKNESYKKSRKLRESYDSREEIESKVEEIFNPGLIDNYKEWADEDEDEDWLSLLLGNEGDEAHDYGIDNPTEEDFDYTLEYNDKLNDEYQFETFEEARNLYKLINELDRKLYNLNESCKGSRKLREAKKKDLWDTIYGELTEDGSQYMVIDEKGRKTPRVNKGAGYDYRDQVTVDRDGNIVVRGKEERDFKAAIDIADKYAKEGVTYNISKGDYGRGYTYGMTIEIPMKDKLGEDLDSLGKDVEKYQDWVDYDMKRYHKISDITKRELDKAGLQVIKDQYGDYEVTAKDRKALSEDLNKWNPSDAVEFKNYKIREIIEDDDDDYEDYSVGEFIELVEEEIFEDEDLTYELKELGYDLTKNSTIREVKDAWNEAHRHRLLNSEIKFIRRRGKTLDESRKLGKSKQKLREKYYYIDNNLSEKKAFWQSMRDAGATEKQLMDAQKGKLITLDGAKYHILDKALPGTEFREGYSKNK